jgi:hypothetical protein
MIALGVTGFGCSSTSNPGGTGGSVGTGGSSSGGTTGRQGGTTGSLGGAGGSSVDAGQDTAAVLPACSPAPNDHDLCNSNPTCTKNCGVNISDLTTTRAQKTCTCSGASPTGMWSCPSAAGACSYPTDVDLTCLRLPTPVPACATDPATDGGAGLIRPGTTVCQVPNSETCGNVCGSPTVASYQDSSGGGKMGYCVCIAGKFQCASVAEWPTFP